MPIGFGGFGGGGDGGGLHTRRPPDIFNEPAAATIAVARTARNTYFTANLGDLAEFQGDQSLAIVLRVTGAPDVFQTYAAGQEGLAYDQTQWLDRTDAVDGPQGYQGRFELFIHTNSAGTPSPATPVGGTYVVGTSVFTPPAGTTEAPTNPGVGEDVYISQAVVDPKTQMGTVTPIWSLWIERAHVSSGITSVSSDTTLAGIGIAADPLSVVNPITAVNPTAAFTDRATSLQVGATVYELPDDVLDVTGVGLPGLTADNYQQIFIDHDTPRVWVGHRDITGNARGTWNPTPIVADDYIGTFITPPAPTDAGQQYYDQTYHSWFAVAGGLGSYYWFQDSFGDIYPSSDWLGEQASDDAALHVIRANFDPTRRYLYYLIGSTSPLGIRELDVPTYVAPTTPRTVYVAEPISAPAGVGSITGLTAGGGITLNGAAGTVSSGVVGFGIDPSLGVFPTIPLVKGGTGATTAVAARTALGLGTAAVLDTGVADGDIPLLGSSGVLDPDRMAVSGAVDTVLTYQTGGTTAWLAYAGLTSVTSGNSLSGAGTVALPLNVVGQTNHLASSTRYSPGGIIDATIGELGARDANNGHMISFEIPAGVPNDSTAISLRVNSNTARGIFDHTETRIIGSDLQGVGQWITVQRILTEYYTLGTLGAAVGGVDSYATAVDVTFASGEVGVSISGNHSFATISDTVDLGLGTAALLDTGIGDGNIPLLDSGGLLDDARIPAEIMRDSEFAAAFVAALTSAVTGNIETNIAVTVSSTGKLDFVSGSGITSVASDASLVGLGTAGNVLGIADEGVQESNLAVFGAPSTTEDQILAWDYANTRMEWQVGTGSAGVQGAFPIFIFRNAGTVPATPTGGSYVVSTGVLTPPANWTVAPSTPGTGEETYVSRYQVNPLIHTGTITPVWSAAYEEAGSGLVSVAHDTAFTGDGTSTNPIALAIAGAAFPVIPVAKGGTGGTDAGTARTGIGLATAVTAIGESGGNLTVEYADGSTFNVPLEEGGSFRGEGHEVFVAGDTFLQLPNGTRFEFGDYAIVDDILFIYNQGAERTGVQPDNIATQANFTEIPRILPNPTGTAVGAVTSLGIGDEIYTVADPLTANFETLTNMSVGSISPSDIFFFRDINVDGNRKLSIGALRQYLDDVIDVTNAGLPTLTVDNYRRFFIDHDTPRVWVGHREVTAATPAGGTTAEFTNASFDGAVTVDPVVTEIGRFIYHTTLHRWETSRTANGTFFFLPLSFNTIFTTTVGDTSPIWLGEQPDDETAIGLIDTFADTSTYYYYHQVSGTIQLLDNTTYTDATGRMVNYGAEPISSPTGLGTGTITDIITPSVGGLSGGTSSGVATLSLDIDGLNVFQTTEINTADSFVVRDTSSSTAPYSSINLGRLVGHMAGNTSTLSESGGRMSVALGGINELYLDGTNDPTTGQVLSAAGSNQFTWIDATGGGTDTNDYATAGTFTLSGSDLSLQIRGTSGFTTFTVPVVTLPAGGVVDTNDFVDTAALTISALDLTLTLGRTGTLADVVSAALTLPDPLVANIETLTNMSSSSIQGTHDIFFFRDESDTSANPNRKLTIQTLADFMAGSTTLSAANGVLSVAAAGILRANLSRPLQAYFDSVPSTLYDTATGILNFQLTSAYGPEALDADTYIFVAPANIGGASTDLSVRINTSSSVYALQGTDNTRVVESDLTSAQKYVATFVNDRWFLTAGLASGGGGTDKNDYVDTAALSLNATNQLVATIGRTGTLADIVTTPLTLPSGATGIQTITPGDGIDVAISGTERTVSLETQYRGIHLGIDFFPDFNLLAGFYGITLNIPNLSFQALGNSPTGTTFSFQIPTPVEDLGTDASVLTFRPGTSGVTQDIVSQANGFPLTRGDLVAGAWHTVRKAVTDYVLIEPTAVVDNDALALSAPNTESPIEAASRRAVATAIAGVAGNKRTFLVPQAGVGGTVDDIELTTGVAINLEDGDELYFTPVAGNTGPVTVAVDGNPAIDMVIYRNQGLRALKVGDLINAPAFVIFQESDNRFLWRPAAGSTAQYYEVGTGNFDIAILGPQGLFDTNRLGSGTSPTAGQYLAWASAGAAWIDLPAAGTGTITGITTATGSGLAGGALTGTPSLSLDFNNLTALTTSTIDTLDEFVLEDVSEATTPYRKMNLGNLVAHIAGPTGSGLTSADGLLSLVDEGILEPKLSVTNGPTTGQFLTAADSGRFTWVNAPVTVTVRGTRRQWFVADTDVTGAGNNITLNPRDAALTALQDGDTFVFRPNDDIGTSNSVNVLIRLTSPAKTVQRSNGAGGFTNVVIGDWTTGDLVVLQYSSGLDRLVWLGGMTGTASTRNTGTASGEVAVLNSGGTFDSARLGGGGQANRVLTWASGAATWEDAAAGAGDITAVTTSATSGLGGGGITGALALAMDLSRITASSTVANTQTLAINDATDGLRAITINQLETFFESGMSLSTARITSGVFNRLRLSSDTPATNDVLTYDGTNTVWAPATGGGTGDIEGITTLATSGLAGGAVTGTPSLSLDLSGLAEANGQFITSGTDRLYIENRDETPYQQQISIFELQQALMIATNTAHQNPAEQDRFFVSDVSYQGGTPRYIRWDTLRTRFTNDATLDWADAVNEEDDFAPTRKTVAESLAAVTEPQLVISNDPSADDVLSWNGTEMTWAPATAPPPATHTSYTATGADQTFTEANFLAGTSGTGNAIAVADWVGMQYIAFARPTSAGVISELYWYAAGQGRGNNQIAGWTVQVATESISGEDHYVVYSNNLQNFIAGIPFVLEVGP